MDEPAIPGASRVIEAKPSGKSITAPRPAIRPPPRDVEEAEDLSLAFSSGDPLSHGRELTSADIPDISVSNDFDPWADMDGEEDDSEGFSLPESSRDIDMSSVGMKDFAPTNPFADLEDLGFSAVEAEGSTPISVADLSEDSTPFADLRAMGFEPEPSSYDRSGRSGDEEDPFADDVDLSDPFKEFGNLEEPAGGQRLTDAFPAAPEHPPSLFEATFEPSPNGDSTPFGDAFGNDVADLSGFELEFEAQPVRSVHRTIELAESQGVGSVPSVEVPRSGTGAFVFDESHLGTRGVETEDELERSSFANSEPTLAVDLENIDYDALFAEKTVPELSEKVPPPKSRPKSDAFGMAARRTEELSSRDVPARPGELKVEKPRPQFGTMSQVRKAAAAAASSSSNAGITRPRGAPRRKSSEYDAPKSTAPRPPLSKRGVGRENSRRSTGNVKTPGGGGTVEDLIRRVGNLQSVPNVAVEPSKLTSLNLDSRSGFLLSQIDGTLSYDDIIELGILPRDEVIRTLDMLVRDGVISS